MSQLPRSETQMGVNVSAMLLALATLWLCASQGWVTDLFWRTLLVLAMASLPILSVDIFHRKLYRHPATGFGAKRTASLPRIATKCLGLYALFASFALLYALFPEYEGRLYNDFERLMRWLLPTMVLLAPPYFYACDRYLSQPEDGYYHLGRLLLRRRGVDTREIMRTYRNWLVKAFFLPLMIAYAVQNIESLSHMHFSSLLTFGDLYLMLNNGAYLIDLLYATAGYICTLRIANAHIRSSEPTFLGWAAAIACYNPFWSMLIGNVYLSYGSRYDFFAWFRDYPLLLTPWGSVILALTYIYASATVALGIRFSNLTYRGLVTNGPYAFCKHPAYVAKNASWWMISLPFLSQEGLWTAISHSLLLIGVNLLYFLRARTEERHLSHYPEYVAYAEAMNTHSLFAPLARAIPYLQYRKPDPLPTL